MSRIRNTLRFQTPEERVLNGLLALVVIVLLTVAIAKVRDDRVEAAPEVKGVTVTRGTLPATGGAPRTTTTTVGTTTSTISPAQLFAFALAVQRAQEPKRTTTTTVPPKGSAPGSSPVAPPVGVPPTTRPTTATTRPTSTTSRPTTTSTSTTTTTTTTSPPLQGG